MKFVTMTEDITWVTLELRLPCKDEDLFLVVHSVRVNYEQDLERAEFQEGKARNLQTQLRLQGFEPSLWKVSNARVNELVEEYGKKFTR